MLLSLDRSCEHSMMSAFTMDWTLSTAYGVPRERRRLATGR